MSDHEIVAGLSGKGIGACSVLDARYNCPSCFCERYFKSSAVKWTGKGWPLDPVTKDSTGCISSTQFGGYTADMATSDWVHNAAAQARDAFAHPSNPCQVDQKSTCPAEWLGHAFHDSYMRESRLVCDYDGIIYNSACRKADAMLTAGSHGAWCQAFRDSSQHVLLSLARAEDPKLPNALSAIRLSDKDLVNQLLTKGIGSCSLLDATVSCPTCACGHYFKSTTVSWNGKGWPLNPVSKDSTGCVSSTQFNGYTADMATSDWVHNAAAQARDAFAHPSNPCQVDQSQVCPAQWLGHAFHDSYIREGRLVCDYDGAVADSECQNAKAMLTSGSHGTWCQAFLSPGEEVLLSLSRKNK